MFGYRECLIRHMNWSVVTSQRLVEVHGFNFGMLNNSVFKKAINNFGKFYSLKNIYRNIKICLTLCY